jgi:citrate lyase beta subunit
MHKPSPYALGATLYMPATRSDLPEIVQGRKLAGLKSMVICLEDAISERELPHALENLRCLLRDLPPRAGGPLLFVRPRQADMAARIADWPLSRRLDGLVLPKIQLGCLRRWQRALDGSHLLLMPTLETREVFDPYAVTELRDAIGETLGERVLALRIGGNDLLGCLGLRRSRVHTLYQGPLGQVIGMLAGIMGSAGYALTAPVLERLDDADLLHRELQLDIEHGLVGKTAIHPGQVAIIHQAFSVDQQELAAARAILQEDAPAVFRFAGAMCEPATHRRWAEAIQQRAEIFGIRVRDYQSERGRNGIRA